MDKVKALLRQKWVCHIRRAIARFGNRQGSQFAAAVTYFSILAVIPVAMLAFSGLGLTLSLQPQLLESVKEQITQQLGSGSGTEKLTSLIDKWITNWPGVGIFGLLSALYAGSGWVSNLKAAVRAQWRPEFEQTEDKPNFFKQLLLNMLTLIAMLIVGTLAMAASQLGSSMNAWLMHALKLDTLPGANILAGLVTFVITWLVCTGMYLFVFRVLPRQSAKTKPWLLGSLWAAFALSLMLHLGGVLVQVFAKNQAAALFGPLFVFVLMFNIFAQMTLFFAAWIATERQPAVARHYDEADEPLKGRTDIEMAEHHWEAAEEDRKRQEAEKAGEPWPVDQDENPYSARSAWLRQRARQSGPEPVPASPGATSPVSQEVAAKAVRIGTTGGYAVGAATGVGIGALIAAAVKRWGRT